MQTQSFGNLGSSTPPSSNSSFPSSHLLSFYEILNVPQDASFELIKSSYQSKALFLHPDKTGSETSSISFVQLQEAWDVLRDPFKRKLYDKSLKVALEKNELPLFEDVDLDEMEYNEKEASYFKACRCGGEGFKVFETQLEEGIEKFTCGSCSFMIHLSYQIQEE